MVHTMKIHNNDGKYFVKEKALERLYDDLVTSLMDRLIKRLQKRGTADLIDNPYIWQLEKLNDMHLLTEEVVQQIAKYGRVSEKVLRDVIANEGYQIYLDSHEQLTKALQSSRLPNPLVQDTLNSIANQTIGEIDNLLNTTLPVSVQKSYKKTLENAVANVVSGSDSSESAINKAVQSLVEIGFTGFIDRGGRRWTAERYAKTVVKTTTYRVYRDMRERPADELGVDTFYYSAKSSAREMCAPLQHKIVTKGVTRIENGETIYSLLDYGYGKPGGCLGINCGHYLTPFVVGVNEKPTLSEELENLTAEEAIENARHEAQIRAYDRELKANKQKQRLAREQKDEDALQRLKLREYTLRASLKSFIDNNLDYMAKSKLFEFSTPNGKVERISTKRLHHPKYDIWVQDKSKKIRHTVFNVAKHLNKYEDVPSVVVVKRSKLKGIAAYDYKTDTLYVSDLLHSNVEVKKMLSTGYFASKNIKDIVRHEMLTNSIGTVQSAFTKPIPKSIIVLKKLKFI